MVKRNISPEARRKMALAAKRRWAAHRANRKSSSDASSGNWSSAKRAAQGRKIRAAWRKKRAGGAMGRESNGEFGDTATETLIAMRRRIDQELADRLVRGHA